jgi:hypothetical protein
MNKSTNPPLVLAMARVLAYAIVDTSVSFTGRQRLFVDGKLLGKVPKIALCQSMDDSPTAANVLIFYCNDAWDILGIVGAETLGVAQAEVERCYSGISKKWILMQTTEIEAREWIRTNSHDVKCAFCGRFPSEVFMSHNSIVICKACIDEFHDAIHDDTDKQMSDQTEQ